MAGNNSNDAGEDGASVMEVEDAQEEKHEEEEPQEEASLHEHEDAEEKEDDDASEDVRSYDCRWPARLVDRDDDECVDHEEERDEEEPEEEEVEVIPYPAGLLRERREGSFSLVLSLARRGTTVPTTVSGEDTAVVLSVVSFIKGGAR